MGLDISGIVGLDLSLTSTGFARIGLNPKIEPVFHNIFKTDPKEGTDIERCLKIAQEIVMHSTKADLFFIEDYAYGIPAKVSRLATLGELGGVVKIVIMKHTKCEPFVVTPGTWKKFLCGKGNLNKDSFKLEVFKKYDIEPMGNDDAVAIAICDFAACALRGEKHREMLKYEQACIKKYREDHPELRTRLQALANRLVD